MTKWLVGVVIVVLAVGLAVFEPWRLFTSSELDEPAPTAGIVAAPSATPAPAERPAERPTDRPAGRRARATPTPTPTPAPTATPQDLVLAAGQLVPAEHATSGRAQVLRLADGQRVVRLEGLATSDGPDLHVWLSDQPSGGEWGSYDDGRYVRLGDLKATHGNQNYLVPPEVDLPGLTSVVIWCDRFNVAFGTAPLALG